MAKVEQQMALVNVLETQLAASRAIAARLPMFSHSGLSSRWAMTWSNGGATAKVCWRL